ncbi:hypothetical protein OCU04_003337 [Sclerotinia nivalis]|uniref:Uncharacterized protein n=1 Tax=Sclerotinia nivalis TaxID=352851 RepID=A0A9X0ARQ2_9HELO|nr:hypothetical protein OCU04_003337 [Sclerotinia nivalis]
MDIDDDSLSYINHTYWLEVIQQIVESRWGNRVSVLQRDAMFSSTFRYINTPSYDDGEANARFGKPYKDCSEAVRFKVMIEKLWNDCVGRDRKRQLYREGWKQMPCDSADETTPGRDFGNTICSMPAASEGFFLYVMATLKAAQEYAVNRSQRLAPSHSPVTSSDEKRSEEAPVHSPQEAPGHSPVTSSDERRPEETYSYKGNESPRNKEESDIDKPISISSNEREHSNKEPSPPSHSPLSFSLPMRDNESPSNQEVSDVEKPMSISSNETEHSNREPSSPSHSPPLFSLPPPSLPPPPPASEPPSTPQPPSLSLPPRPPSPLLPPPPFASNPLPPPPPASEPPSTPQPPSLSLPPRPPSPLLPPPPFASNPLSSPPQHPPLPHGIDVTGPGASSIKSALIGSRRGTLKYFQDTFGVWLEIFSAESEDYIFCRRLDPWGQSKHVENQMALDILGVWVKKAMHQSQCQHLRAFIEESMAGHEMTLEQLHKAACGDSLLVDRSMFKVVPKDAKQSNPFSQLASVNDWALFGQRYRIEITNFHLAGIFLGRGGTHTKECIRILTVFLAIERVDKREYIVCKPHKHQMIDRYLELHRKRCQMASEIVGIWVEKAKYNQQYMTDFLVELKASEGNMTLEEIHTAAMQSTKATPMKETQSNQRKFEGT